MEKCGNTAKGNGLVRLRTRTSGWQQTHGFILLLKASKKKILVVKAECPHRPSRSDNSLSSRLQLLLNAAFQVFFSPKHTAIARNKRQVAVSAQTSELLLRG